MLPVDPVIAWKFSASAWSLAIAASDWRERRIPNALLAPAAVLALIALSIQGASPLGASGLAVAKGAGLALLLTLPGYLLRALGAGDVKLLFVIALLGGVWMMLGSFAIGALLTAAGGLVGLKVRSLLGLDPKQGRHLPFGSALAVGLIIMMFAGDAPPGWR
ncbi:Peptidase_A24 domain-containing protein [Thauera humireducens]|uniref:prepilin peptidase n=1 Tax=Thauera humireducens TaxID=1134435 RepID=UPI002467A6CE|nr:prepilin peptidase [Thauera humireducens]CAH1746292.1 Peptidase_A24 domain-containing protein [Thauera humireducens]